MSFKSTVLAACLSGLPLVTLAEYECSSPIKVQFDSHYDVYNKDGFIVGKLEIFTASKMLFTEACNEVVFAISGNMAIDDCEESLSIVECDGACEFAVLPLNYTQKIDTSEVYDEESCVMNGFFQLQASLPRKTTESLEPYFEEIHGVFDSACEQ